MRVLGMTMLDRVGDVFRRIPAWAWIALLTLPYWTSGATKLLDFGGAIGEVRGLTGLEPAPVIAAMVIALQLGGSIHLTLDRRRGWISGLLLAGFTAVATLFAHAYWTKPAAEQARDFITFTEHLGLIGGLLLAARLSASRTDA